MSSCAAPAGSPCRTGKGKVAVQYHTARFRLVPSLAKALNVPTPARRAGQTVGGTVPRAIRPQREARMGAMPDTMQPAPLPSAYQLRVVVRGVSPLSWRRLLVPADTTIADLHAVLQTAFGWTGTHLHRFVVQGREYGIGYFGGPSFGDDPVSYTHLRA